MEPDEDLIERFRTEGDEDAFSALVERYRRDVYRLAWRLSGNHDDAHDLSQEAFVRVYRGLGRFRGEAGFRTWLYRIVTNVALNHRRKHRRERESRVDVETLELPVEPSGLSELLAREARERVGAAIEKLPARQRQTLVLKVFDELKYSEIADVMGCSVGTAKANFFHAVQSLRRHLGAPASRPPEDQRKPERGGASAALATAGPGSTPGEPR